MSRLVINGKRPLQGTIPISGAKNSVLKLMAAATLVPGVSTLTNVPEIEDVHVMQKILHSIGASTELQQRRLRIDASSIHGQPAAALVGQLRASIQLLGPLIARLGKVSIHKPGGCALGERPIGLHLDSLEQLGATFSEDGDCLLGEAQTLYGREIRLGFPSVGATENLMMAAVLARGTTVIFNAAREPEVVELERFLNKMGACITGGGTSIVQIKGCTQLRPATHDVMPDRIEVGTYLMAAAAIPGSQVVAKPVRIEHLAALCDTLEQMGVTMTCRGQSLELIRPRKLRAVSVGSKPYPGFATDLQPQYMALATQAEGKTIIRESVYKERFSQVDALRKFGARITMQGRLASVVGPCPLTGCAVQAMDLRCGAALVIAGLAAKGTTVIHGGDHIRRGYEDMAAKLRQVGADIEWEE